MITTSPFSLFWEPLSFFELMDIPVFDSRGLFYCQGTIRCRLQGATIMQALERICKSRLEFYKETGLLGQVDLKNTICRFCHRYSLNKSNSTFDILRRQLLYIYKAISTVERSAAFRRPWSGLWSNSISEQFLVCQITVPLAELLLHAANQGRKGKLQQHLSRRLKGLVIE